MEYWVVKSRLNRVGWQNVKIKASPKMPTHIRKTFSTLHSHITLFLVNLEFSSYFFLGGGNLSHT